MSYTPTQGLFVNGRVADANEILNEFGAIAGAIGEVATEISTKTLEVTKEAKQYTDTTVGNIVVDGGTF